MSELRRRQRAIESTIAEYKAKIADCERELAECSDMLQQSVYPVLTLPNELTSEIFVHCLTSRDDWYAYSTPHPEDAPVLLLHVCRAWRSIALSTPGLWADLTLDFDMNLPPAIFDPPSLKEFLDDWLARAGARPLSLYLEGGFRREEDDLRWPEGDIQRVVSTILTRLSPRIQTLSLHTDMKWYPQHSLDFPLLQDLSLDPLDIWGGLMDHPESPIQLFSAALQIQELFLNYIPPSLLAISWETLTVFTAEELSSKECVDVLRLATSLVKCVLSIIPLDPDTGAISHPNLKSFEFCTDDDTFFQFLTFPALENLDIDVETVENEHLLRFISQSSSALLKLTSRPVPSNSLSEMVALNDLHLFILSSDYLGEFFSLLNRTHNPSFLPRLQTLELSRCPPFVNTSLVDALSSRHGGTQGGRASLRSFRQNWSRDAETNAFSVNYEGSVGLALAELTKKGMDIYIGVEK